MVNSIINLPMPIELVYKVQIRSVQFFEKHGAGTKRKCTLCQNKLIAGEPWAHMKIDSTPPTHKPVCIRCLQQHGILW